MVPADDQAIVLPCASVIVIMVLLNEAATCATPDAMFFRSRRRTRVASLPILNPLGLRAVTAPASSCLSTRSRGLLFPGNCLGGAFTGARIGVRALAANRKPLAVAQATVAAEIHQSFDVQLNFAPQITLYHVVAVDDFADLEHLRVGELRNPPPSRQINLAHDILSNLRPDAMDVLQRDHHALVGR